MAARFLGTTSRQVERWLAGDVYPGVQRWPIIDHVYALALDAIRKSYLRGTIKVGRQGLDKLRRPMTKLQHWSKRCTSNQMKNKSPVLWEDYETDTYTRDSGGRTEINVKASPVPDPKTKKENVPTMRTPPPGSSQR
jgi:hypothetical protein